jgi:hypothetical protein
MAKYKVVKSQYEVLPSGNYTCKFSSLQPWEGGEYGAALRWSFEVLEGPKQGKVISDLTPAENPTPKNKFGRMLAAISGKALAVDLEIDPDQYLQSKYLVVLQEIEGKNKVAAVSKL